MIWRYRKQKREENDVTVFGAGSARSDDDVEMVSKSNPVTASNQNDCVAKADEVRSAKL